MIILTRPDWLDVVAKCRASRNERGERVCAVDTETVDRGFPDVQIVGFSLAWFENEGGHFERKGCYVPIGHLSSLPTLRAEDVYADLKSLLESDDIEWSLQNAKYDLKVLTLFPGPTGQRGITLTKNIVDTMILSFLFNTNGVGSPSQVMLGEGEHGLKALSEHLLHYKFAYELSDIAPTENEPMPNGGVRRVMRVDQVPIFDEYDAAGSLVQRGLGLYAHDDAVQTLGLREHFVPMLDADPDTATVWRVIQKELIFCLAEMEMCGIELDVAMLVEMRLKVETELVGIYARMYDLRPGRDFDELVDAGLVQTVCRQWDDLDRRFALDPDDADFPKTIKTTGRANAKVDHIIPWNKAAARKALIDASGLRGHPVMEKIRDDSLRSQVALYPALSHKVFNPGSNNRLNDILFDECHLAPLGDKGKNGLWSTKGEYIDVWADEQHDPFAKELQRLREIEKLRGTYLVGMVEQLSKDGRLRTRFNQGIARTGRLSSSGPNLQNIPTSSEFPIRAAFVATGITGCLLDVHEWLVDDDGTPTRPKHVTVTAIPGYVHPTLGLLDGGYELNDGWVVRWWGKNPPWVLCVADYNQLEIRLLAHVSADPTLVAAVAGGQDVHALTAQACFDEISNALPLSEVKRLYPKLRKKAKVINFAILYGQGAKSTAKAIGVSLEEAKTITTDRYMKRYPGVKQYIDSTHAFVVKHGYIKTAVGRKRHLPAAQLTPASYKAMFRYADPKWEDKMKGYIAGAKRQAQNGRIQGFAADLVALAQRDLGVLFKATTLGDVGATGDLVLNPVSGYAAGTTEQFLWNTFVRILLQVHDEFVEESHPAVANWVRTATVERMENAGGITLRVPIKVDAALGTSWQSAKD